MKNFITAQQPRLKLLWVLLLLLLGVRTQNIDDRFKCYMTDTKKVDLRYDGVEKYVVIEEIKDVESKVTSYTVCRSLNDGRLGDPATDYVVYVVECLQLGTQLLSTLTKADIVDRSSDQGRQCKNSKRAISFIKTTTVAPVRVDMTIEAAVPTTTTPVLLTTLMTATTEPGTSISERLSLQVLDETGFVIESALSTELIQLRIQSLTPSEYQAPVINRCWYRLHSNLEDEISLDGDTLFVQYGCSLKEPVLLETRAPVFNSNGPLEVQTMLFDLQSLYEHEFEYITIKCELDLCTQDQYCRTQCPADGNMYRVPIGETIQGNISTTFQVQREEPMTPKPPPKKPTTEGPHIIRHTVAPRPRIQKTGMEKSQPYLIIACIAVGGLVLLLLCYISYRLLPFTKEEPGQDNNPQEPSKTGSPGSLLNPVTQSRFPYSGVKFSGISPPPVYNPGTPFRGRLRSAAISGGQMGQSMTQPLLSASPPRGHSGLGQQRELVMSPGQLSDMLIKSNTTLPSRYQNGTAVGGEYYPARDRQLGREFYHWPDGQMEQNYGNLLSRDLYQEPSSAEKHALRTMLAREAAIRQSGVRRELFSPSSASGQKHSEVGNLISKSLSEYIDRHGVEGLSSHGHI